jgi:GT2 family glycosyltransferase
MEKRSLIKASDLPSLSLIVPAHQNDESLRCCLNSISNTNPLPNEVILVDDGAGDTIRKLAAELGYRWVQNSRGRGPARARNTGAQAARSELLFFVDSDVTIPPDAVLKAQSIFRREHDLDALIGSYDEEPAARNFLSQYRNLFHHYIHQISSTDASTFWGACGIIRRSIFQRMGGFNEKYPRPCIEDIELGGRLKKAGYRIRLAKEFQCKHLKSYGIMSLLKSDLLDRALPWTELILRERVMVNDLNLRSSSRLSVVLILTIAGLLIGGFWRSGLFLLAAIVFAVVMGINLPVYRFFYRKRGLWFMIRAIPWHCIYYLCCGLGFVIGWLRIFPERIVMLLGKMFTRRKAV